MSPDLQTADATARYPDDLVLGDAIKAYFADYGFGEDGGYDAKTVKLKLGPIRVSLKNVDARKKAVPYHDAHHILTGYLPSEPTVKIGSPLWEGEAEVAAWEIGTGWIGLRYWAEPWLINSYALMIGLFVCPRKTFRAYVRGRASSNLYSRPFNDELRRHTLGELRRQLGLKKQVRPSRLSDMARFAVAGVAASLTVVLSVLVILLPLATFQVVARALRSLRQQADMGQDRGRGASG
jgi:hypothetical protein